MFALLLAALELGKQMRKSENIFKRMETMKESTG
jgi:hypothetical protein